MDCTLVTVWDGAHRGIGADLLLVPAEVRREATPLDGHTPQGALFALEQLSAHPMTAAQLAALAGWKNQTARHALYELRQSGIIPREALKSRRVPTGRQCGHLVYWVES